MKQELETPAFWTACYQQQDMRIQATVNKQAQAHAWLTWLWLLGTSSNFLPSRSIEHQYIIESELFVCALPFLLRSLHLQQWTDWLVANYDSCCVVPSPLFWRYEVEVHHASESITVLGDYTKSLEQNVWPMAYLIFTVQPDNVICVELWDRATGIHSNQSKPYRKVDPYS